MLANRCCCTPRASACTHEHTTELGTSKHCHLDRVSLDTTRHLAVEYNSETGQRFASKEDRQRNYENSQLQLS
eukprot:2157266-Rhodomonas_salina.1